MADATASTPAAPPPPKQADKPLDELLRRPLYLYGLPAEVLDTLVLKTDAETQGIAVEEEETTTPAEKLQVPPTSDEAVGAQACSLCGLSFSTVPDQRGHLKSDLHHFNLKQKLRGLKPVTEGEFETLIGDLDESLSGSDSQESEDDEDESGTGGRKETTLTALLKKQATLAEQRNQTNDGGGEEAKSLKKRGSGTPPLMWFTCASLPENTYFGIYRAVFSSDELSKEDRMVDFIKQRQLAPISMPKQPKDGADGGKAPASYDGRHIFMCMIGGGHFAGMVVSLAPRQSRHGGPLNREATILAHKTFHRYTTRRKQGGSQSANDAAKGAAHSAGSSLRRYNEQALVEDVRGLLQDWKGLIDSADLLFIRATGVTNRRTIYGDAPDQVIKPNDSRIRGFPFNTRRATQNELMRSFIELTRLKVREIVPRAPEATEPAIEPTKAKPAKPTAPKLTEEEETALLHTSQIQALIRRSKLPALLSYLSTNDLPPSFKFYPPEPNHHAPTPLHLASSLNSAPLVSGLLIRGGADPGVQNADGKAPFDLAGDRATRDAFRVARSELGEQKWDWEAANVPPALKKEDAERRGERERKEAERAEAERRRAEEERLAREGPKVVDSKRKGPRTLLGAGHPKTAQERREEEARGLTPEQRARLERERRARAAEERIRRMQAGGGQ